MQKKLTITLDEQVYTGLHTVIGRGRISQFIESVVRPHVLSADMSAAYRDMAAEEEREAEALEWSEATRKAMADLLTTVSKQRLSNREGSLSVADMLQVEQAIKVQLGLP